MAVRTARGGGAVRWAYGVLLTLCVALAVLVHHEATVTSAPPMSSSAMAAHAMPNPAQGAQAVLEKAVASASDTSPHSVGAEGCAMSGMQHCAAAGIGSVQFALPGQGVSDSLAILRRAAQGRAPAAAVGRAPPDLSVLSQLRM